MIWLDLLKDATCRPRIIAHRGDSFRAPENTIEAAQLAFEAGAFAWELDVHLSSDGVPVVIHDESLLRTTDVEQRFSRDPRRARSYPVSKFSLEELQSLDVGSWFVSKKEEGRSCWGFGSRERVPNLIIESCERGRVRIPTLRQALEFTRDRNWLVNIEIKSFPNADDRVVTLILDQITELEVSDRVLISSFNHIDVAQVVRQAPWIATGVLAAQPMFQAEAYVKKHIGASCYHPSTEVLGAATDLYIDSPCASRLNIDQIRPLITNDCPILVYTVNPNQRVLASHLAESGISAIFTDDPSSLIRQFEEMKSRVPAVDLPPRPNP